MKVPYLRIVMMCSALGCLAAAAPGDAAWTRFRGPNGCGTAETSTFPAAWTDRDYHWKVKLPGFGFSSPVLWRDLRTASHLMALGGK